MKISQNKYRIDYLLSLYNMRKEELLLAINDEKLKKTITWDDIYCDEIELNYLKRIDKVFKMGLVYYLDPEVPVKNSNASIFFRKDNFNTELNIGAKKKVREFEDLKVSISAISKMSDLNLVRKLETYTINDNPKDVAFSLRDKILSKVNRSLGKKNFLKDFINNLGEYNIFVFEFVETFNKKEKANIDGFYLHPNTIVLRRLQKSLSREIFTLAHELGHYLLDKEEIEKIDVVESINSNLNDIEIWCNNFSYNFLLGKENDRLLSNIEKFDVSNDYGYKLIDEISNNTFLSRIAIYTNLLLNNQLSKSDYFKIKESIEEEWRNRLKQEEREKEEKKALGIEIRGSAPKPIIADITTSVLNIALNSGVINEYEYCKTLKIKPENIDKYFYL